MPITPGDAEAREKDIKDIRSQQEAISDLVEEYEREQATLDVTSARYQELSDEIKKSKDEYVKLGTTLVPLLKSRVQEYQTIHKVSVEYDALTKKIVSSTNATSKVATVIRQSVSEYHSYNLEVQRLIDETGKFVGQSGKARQEFDSFRRSLNLTRKSAIEFSDAWVQGMRLGVANDQLKQMIGNLQKIHGQTQGLKMAKEILATPTTRQTIQGAVGRDVGSTVQAMRVGNMQQMQALASNLKIPGGRTSRTEEAIRFQRAVDKYDTVVDDLKAGMQAFAAAGVGPETAALLAPVTNIARDVASIAQNSSLIKQWVVQGGGQILAKIPGVGGLMGKVSGGAGGGGAGVTSTIGGMGLNLSKGALLRGGLFAALGEGGKAIGDHVGGELDKRGYETSAKWARVGGMTARGAGLGAALGSVVPGLGTAAGAGVGATIGGVVGVAQEFGDTLLKYGERFGKGILVVGGSFAKGMFGYVGAFGKSVLDAGMGLGKTLIDSTGWFGKTVTAAGAGVSGALTKAGGWLSEKFYGVGEWLDQKIAESEGGDKVDFGDLLRNQGTLTKTVQDNMSRLGPTLESLPESMRAAIATRAGEVGAGTVGRGDVEQTREAFTKQIRASLDEMIKTVNSDRQDVVGRRDENLRSVREIGAKALGGAQDPEQRRMIQQRIDQELKAINDVAQDALNSIEKTAQETLQRLDVGRGARVEMQRMETRRGQVGVERETASGRFRRTGAVTGDVAEITRFQEEVNRTYGDEVKLLNEARANVNQEWDIQDQILTDRINANKTNKELVAQSELQLRDNQRRRADDNRSLNNQEEILKLNRMEADVANARAKVTAYELTATFRRAQAQRSLAQSQGEFARERGTTPQEIGGIARTQAAGSQQMLDDFNKTYKSSLRGLEEQVLAARAPGGEGESKAVLLEREIYDLRQKGVELERAAFSDRVKAATAEAEERQNQLGIQRNILETVRDSAARTGQSWRVQMGYQTQIIQASRQELDAAYQAFTAAKEAGETGAPLMRRQLDVVQKQAALQEAQIGKQRDFLEKAVAAGFGMGGGSKALPNINPRIFGPIVKDVLGQERQGMQPLTMEEQRAMMGRGVSGGIGVGGGGINAVPGRPGVNPGVGALGAAAGALGAAAGALGAAGGPRVKGDGVDVSGNFAVVVKTDNEMFTAEVQKMIRAELKSSSSTGYIA